MGFGKSLKKALKKVASIADPADVLGKGEGDKKAAEVAAPAVEAPAPAAAAPVVEAPKGDSETTEEGDTEAAKKAARANGKKKLSVARSSGTGLNI